MDHPDAAEATERGPVTSENEESEIGVLSDGDRTPAAGPEPFEYGGRVDIRNSVWIEKNPAYRAALAEWDRREKYLRKRVDRMEGRATDLTSEIYQIIGFFAVYQGFAVSTVLQLGDFACPKIWSPILLTSMSTFITVFAVWQKFKNLKKLESSTHREKHELQETEALATSLRRQGPTFRFDQESSELRPLKSKLWISSIAIVFAILAFTAAFIVSYFVIVCDSFLIYSWKDGLPM